KSGNKIIESSKFLIKGINASMNKYSDILSIDSSIDEFKFLYTTKMNESTFSNEIIFPLGSKDKIFIMRYKQIGNTSNLYINLFSQGFIYNQNFIENIIRFFNISEFDQISDMIKSADFLKIDID